MDHTPTGFDTLYRDDDDPWHLRSRWYEARKRALTVACLPRQRYASVYEPGCANAELSAALATRCDGLLVSDASAAAMALARERLADFDHVRFLQASTPEQWPDERFDLIILSEFIYYLSAPAQGELAERALASLQPGGTLLACHWRRPIEGCALSGDEVHRRLGERLGLSPLCTVVEPDLRIDVWSSDPRSVAQHEGFA